MTEEISCPRCTLFNKNNDAQCSMCGYSFVPKWICGKCSWINQKFEVSCELCHSKNGRWFCKICTQLNAVDSVECIFCESALQHETETKCSNCSLPIIEGNSCPYCTRDVRWECHVCGMRSSMNSEKCNGCQREPIQRVKYIINARRKVSEKKTVRATMERAQMAALLLKWEISTVEKRISELSEDILEEEFPDFAHKISPFILDVTYNWPGLEIDGAVNGGFLKAYVGQRVLEDIPSMAKKWFDLQMEKFGIQQYTSSVIARYLGWPGNLDSSLLNALIILPEGRHFVWPIFLGIVSKIRKKLVSMLILLNRSYANENRIIRLSPCELQLADTMIQTWWKCTTCNKKNKLCFNKCHTCGSPEQKVASLTRQIVREKHPPEGLRIKLEQHKRLMSMWSTIVREPRQSNQPDNVRNKVLLKAKMITTDILVAKQELSVHQCRFDTIKYQLEVLQV